MVHEQNSKLVQCQCRVEYELCGEESPQIRFAEVIHVPDVLSKALRDPNKVGDIDSQRKSLSCTISLWPFPPSYGRAHTNAAKIVQSSHHNPKLLSRLAVNLKATALEAKMISRI